MNKHLLIGPQFLNGGAEVVEKVTALRPSEAAQRSPERAAVEPADEDLGTTARSWLAELNSEVRVSAMDGGSERTQVVRMGFDANGKTALFDSNLQTDKEASSVDSSEERCP